jgi:hypothetical protein
LFGAVAVGWRAGGVAPYMGFMAWRVKGKNANNVKISLFK